MVEVAAVEAEVGESVMAHRQAAGAAASEERAVQAHVFVVTGEA